MKTSLRVCWFCLLTGVLSICFSCLSFALVPLVEEAEIENSIQLNTSVVGALSSEDSDDCYSFSITECGKLTLHFSASSERLATKHWYVKLRDANNKELFSTRVYGGNAELVSPCYGLSSGTYYVEIYANKKDAISSEDYTLLLEFEKDDRWEQEPNGSLNQAREMTPDSEYKGTITSESDKDFYSFIYTDQLGEFVFSHAPSGSSFEYWTVRFLYDNGDKLQETRVAMKDGEVKISLSDLELTAGRRYYIVILPADDNRFHTSEYTLLIRSGQHVCQLEQVNAVESTCAETGVILHQRCKTCGLTYDLEGQPIVDVTMPQKSHTWSDWETVLGATCTTAGEQKRSCLVCSKPDQQSVDALGHHYAAEWSVDQEATCQSVGSRSRHCRRSGCTARTDVEEIAVKAHSSNVQKFDEESHWYECVCGEKLQAEAHDFKTNVLKAATCTQQGYARFQCRDCGYAYEDALPYKEHRMGEWTLKTPATCDQNGEEIRTCVSGCGVTETRALEKLPHTYSQQWTTDRAPTCLLSGSQSHHCERCDARADVTAIPATGHTLGGWRETLAPTCTKEGKESRSCSSCDYVEERVGANATGHTFGDWRETLAPTCIEKGKESRSCSSCDHVEERVGEDAAGHTFGDWRETLAPTCTEKGKESRTCSSCDHVEERVGANAMGHTFGDWRETLAPTCTEKGVESRSCSSCDYVEERVGENATGHSFGEWSELRAPTCTEGGLEKQVCGICGLEQSRVVGAELGHSYDAYFTVDTEPTCDEKGQKSRHCQKCDARADVTVIDAIGHTFGEWETVYAPTCTESGKKKHVCVTCGDEELKTFGEAYGHRFEDAFTVDEAATCQAVGSKSRHCQNCSERTDVREIPITGHSFGDWQETVSPTCTEAGEEIHRCIVCQAEETRIGADALGHSYESEWTVDVAPSCHEKGSQSRHCIRCAETADRKAIAMLDHVYDEGTVTVEPTCERTGTKVFTCAVCQNTRTVSLEKQAPVILGETEKKWNPKSGENMVFRSAASLADFVEVRVNREVVPRDCYILREGSTIVELTTEYLKTLGGGAYTIEIVSTTGIASASLEVSDDSIPLWLWLILGAAALPVTCVLIWVVVDQIRKIKRASASMGVPVGATKAVKCVVETPAPAKTVENKQVEPADAPKAAPVAPTSSSEQNAQGQAPVNATQQTAVKTVTRK